MHRLYIDGKHLFSHTAGYGDTGGGKTLLGMAYLREVERLGHSAVVWDPDDQYRPKFFNRERGDVKIDPTDVDCIYWDPRQEYKNEGEAYALANCFFPDNANLKDPFWNNSARGLLAVLSALHQPTISDLALWCANDEEIDRRVVGTEYERILTSNAPGMRSSIIAHLNLIAQPLRMMPQHPEGRPVFSVREYCNHRRGWVFIGAAENYRQIMNPLHAFFLASFIQRLVAMGRRDELPTVHMIFEEASTITVQELHLGIIRLRKTRNPVLYLLQNYSDLKVPYGDRAETIYSQPYYKFFFRLGNHDSAERASKAIGDRKIRKMRETWQAPRLGEMPLFRRSFTWQPEEERIVPTFVLQNLDDRVGYAICPGNITAIEMPIVTMPDRDVKRERIIPPMLRQPGTPLPKPEPVAVTVPLGPSYF